MPYIKPERREQLDKHIKQVSAEILVEHADPTAWAGELNYACTTLALNLLDCSGRPQYWKIAMIAGVFSNISDEFYRRYVSPYEDQKIQENGDVYKS
jgi:hypothetical protein